MSVMLGEATDRPTADASSAPEGHAGQPRAAHRSSRPTDGGCRNARTMRSQPSLLNSGNRASWRSTWFSTAGCLVPPGADADVQSTDADVVDGHCHFRQDRRMAKDHTGYQRVDPRPLGNSCHGGQRRPALERRLGEFRRPTKVVPVPNPFEARAIRGLPQLLQCGVFEAQVELDRYPHAAIFRPLRCVCGAVIEYLKCSAVHGVGANSSKPANRCRSG